jgi:hypothetical protein
MKPVCRPLRRPVFADVIARLLFTQAGDGTTDLNRRKPVSLLCG